MEFESSRSRTECVARIRAAFADCPRPSRGQTAPDAGNETRYVLRNWRKLRREDIEKLEYYGSPMVHDIAFMSSMAFRYYVPAIMILFLTRPEVVDDIGCPSLIGDLESAFLPGRAGGIPSQIALTPAQALAVRDWIGELIPLLPALDVDSGLELYTLKLEKLRESLTFHVPQQDHDADIMRLWNASRPPEDRQEMA